MAEFEAQSYVVAVVFSQKKVKNNNFVNCTLLYFHLKCKQSYLMFSKSLFTLLYNLIN